MPRCGDKQVGEPVVIKVTPDSPGVRSSSKSPSHLPPILTFFGRQRRGGGLGGAVASGLWFGFRIEVRTEPPTRRRRLQKLKIAGGSGLGMDAGFGFDFKPVSNSICPPLTSVLNLT